MTGKQERADTEAPQPETEPATEPAEAEAPAAEEGGEAEPAERKDEAAELRDRLLRALAENENLVRRARREREDTARYAVSNFARDVLNVADNLNRALDAVPAPLRESEQAQPLIEGVELTAKELAATLERHGISRLSPLGEKFNHDLHEALFEVPTAASEPGTVVQVVQDGYLIHDRLLRAARVGVAKAPPDGADGEGAGDGGDGGHAVDTTA